MAFTDAQVPTLGYHTFMIVAENSFGEGVPATAVSYVGVNVPTVITDLTATETHEESGTVTLAWEAPLLDVDGHKLNPALVTYTVADVSTGTAVIKASGIKELSWTAPMCADGEQDLLAFAVAAVTEAGQADAVTTPFIVVGKPYSLPFEEHAPLTGLNHPMEIVAENPACPAQWSAWTEEDTQYAVTSPDEDMGFLGLQATNQGGESTLWTGKIAIPADATDAKLTFQDFNWYNSETKVANENLMQVKMRLADGTEQSVKDVYTTDYEKKNAWMPASVDFGQFAGKSVRIGFRGVCNSYALMFLDDIKLASASWVRTLGAEDAIAVRGLKGAMQITAPFGTPLTVAAASGAVMHSAPALGSETIALPAGVYIVRAGARTLKVMVNG